MRNWIAILWLSCLVNYSFAQFSEPRGLRPSEIERKAFSKIAGRQFNKPTGIAGAAAKSEPIDIFSNLSADELGFGPNVKVLGWASNWGDAICRSLANLNLPMGEKHFPIVVLSLEGSVAATHDFVRGQVACRGYEEALVVPVGVQMPVVLMASPDVLPPWISIEHLKAASLIKMPDGDDWLKEPRKFVGRECERLEAQPASERIENAMRELGSDGCIAGRDTNGEMIIGKWREKYISLYRRDHGSASERKIKALRYSPDSSPNIIDNWGKIDSGIRRAEIDIRVVTKHSSPAEISKQICIGSDVLGRDYRERLVELKIACQFRSSIRVQNRWISDANAKGAIVVTSLVDFIREPDYASLFPILFESKHSVHDYARQQLAQRRKEFFEAIVDGYAPWGRTIWLAMDPRAMGHPNVEKLIEEIRKGPAKNGYRGGVVFFSDLSASR